MERIDPRARKPTILVRGEDGAVVPAVVYDDDYAPHLAVVALLDGNGRETGTRFSASRRAIANCRAHGQPLVY